MGQERQGQIIRVKIILRLSLFFLGKCSMDKTEYSSPTNPSAVCSFPIIRQLSKTPFFRSENLLLEYKNGDECLDTNGSIKRSTLIHFVCDASVSGQVNERSRWR